MDQMRLSPSSSLSHVEDVVSASEIREDRSAQPPPPPQPAQGQFIARHRHHVPSSSAGSMTQTTVSSLSGSGSAYQVAPVSPSRSVRNGPGLGNVSVVSPVVSSGSSSGGGRGIQISAIRKTAVSPSNGTNLSVPATARSPQRAQGPQTLRRSSPTSSHSSLPPSSSRTVSSRDVSLPRRVVPSSSDAVDTGRLGYSASSLPPLPQTPSPLPSLGLSQTSSGSADGAWKIVETTSALAGGSPPCQRSLHAAAVLNGAMYVFGGYDGQTRVNDFHSFSFSDKRWSPVLPSAASGSPPSPRDRHVAVAHAGSFYVFGGFDGTNRVSDFFGFDFSSMAWRQVLHSSGAPPSPRHSHSAVVHSGSMYVFGGYDGSYRSDFHEYDFAASSWHPVSAVGRTPRARYRATCVVHRNTMILFGGHDGTRHLADTHVFDFIGRSWSAVPTEGTPPIPRDSHVAVVHGDAMYIFGGSTGSAMNDLHELRMSPRRSRNAPHQQQHQNNHNPLNADGALERTPAAPIGNASTSGGHNVLPLAEWRQIKIAAGGAAGHRFCHVAVVHGESMFVFGGYDGSHRLNDFIRFDFPVEDLTCDIPPSSLVSDLRMFVNDESLADITFIVEDQPVHAHKIMLMRCSYFRAMLLGEMMESNQSTIRLEQVRHPIFLCLLEYLYTDDVVVPLDSAMELFVAADLFGVPRLQAMCERKMLESIVVENAAAIFHAADVHSARSLRAKALKFILAHFETVSKTSAFEEMARGNVELVFEILRSR